MISRRVGSKNYCIYNNTKKHIQALLDRRYARKSIGFTIVELLVVIVVIGIVAAITIVSYTNVTSKAQESSLRSTLNQAAKSLEAYKLSNDIGESYPSDIISLTDLKLDNSLIWYYTTTPASNEYCFQGTTSSGYIESVSSSGGGIIDKPCGVLDGLVGWWKLNGNALDGSGKGNNGTVSGAVATTGQNGSEHGAYNFDGVDDYITTPAVGLDSSSLNISKGTISVWFYANSLSAYKGVFEITNSSGERSFRIMAFGGGEIRFHPYYSFYTESYASGMFSMGAWTNIVCSYDGTAAKIYKDGVLLSSTDLLINFSSRQGDLFAYIGKEWAGGRNFNGIIDDVRIYNRALSSSEIQSLYNAGAI